MYSILIVNTDDADCFGYAELAGVLGCAYEWIYATDE